MLATIKQLINSTPDISFADYFTDYMMVVQDSNIDREFDFLLKMNRLDVDSMQLLINHTYERLMYI